METEVLLQRSQKLAIRLYSQPDESSSHISTLFLWDPF
jgi:hypothetical protein